MQPPLSFQIWESVSPKITFFFMLLLTPEAAINASCNSHIPQGDGVLVTSSFKPPDLWPKNLRCHHLRSHSGEPRQTGKYSIFQEDLNETPSGNSGKLHPVPAIP